MATHSSTLAGKLPWTEGPGGLQSMGSQRVEHDWATEHTYCSPQWLYQFTFPSTLQEGSLFSTHSPAFIVCRFFDDVTLSDLCDVVPHWSFDLISLITSDVEHFVTCFWPYVCLLSYCSVVSIGLNAYFMACTLVLFLKIRKLYLGFKIWNGAKLQHS